MRRYGFDRFLWDRVERRNRRREKGRPYRARNDLWGRWLATFWARRFEMRVFGSIDPDDPTLAFPDAQQGP